ncbi:MAG: hypothetical protein K6G28_04580 [Acholeplasmatales bacterium]|nr:hypothetical protein [Acholeplasmatales bacterium]
MIKYFILHLFFYNLGKFGFKFKLFKYLKKLKRRFSNVNNEQTEVSTNDD